MQFWSDYCKFSIFFLQKAKKSPRKTFFVSLKKRTLLPRPSARTKNILSWTKFKLSRTKVLSRVKKSIFCLQKSFKMKLPDWKSLENLSSIRNIHIQWLLKVKNGLFNPGQNFCPGQFQYCPGQKIFCPGRWTRHMYSIFAHV